MEGYIKFNLIYHSLVTLVLTYVNLKILFLAVCNSIKNPVTTEILLNFIDRHGCREDDLQTMPPPSSIPRR